MAFELPAEAVAAGAAPADSPFSLPDETQGFSLPGEATQKAIPDLVKDDDFDPISYAMETGDTATAKEVAWQKKQRPMTLKRAGHLVKNFGGAAVDLIKDFGGGLGDIAADTAFLAATPDSPFFKLQGIDENTAKILKEAAATQQMARAQSIEHNTTSFASKLFGKDGFFGPARRRLTQAVLPTAMLFGSSREDVKNALAATETEIQDRDKNPRKYFDDRFDELVEGAKKSQQLTSGHVQDDGAVAGGLNFINQATQFLNGTFEGDLQPYVPTKQFASPEELPQGLIDPDSIRRGSVAADPINLLPLHLPKVAPVLNKVAGAALRTPVQAVRLIAEKTPVLNKVLKYGLPGGAVAYIGHEAMSDPVQAGEDALKALGLYVGVKGVKVLGHVIDNAGAKLMNPKFASAAERAAAEEAMAGRAGFFNVKSNAADLERSVSKVVQGAISAPVAMAPLNLAISDSPEEFAKLEGGVFGFGALGGATSYNPVQGFHPETINAVDTVLRGIGEKKTYGTPLDAAHEAYMTKAPQWVKDGVNAYRGFFDGFKLKNGEEPKIYVLPADQFGAEVNRRNPKVDADSASKQRGFADSDGTILVNGDFSGEAPDILGHEAGGHVAQTIMEMLSPHVAERLQTKAYENLLTPNGKATPELLKFVRAYNKAFDPTGKHQEIQTNSHAIEEWLAEQARAVLQGQGPAKFAAGESVRQRIADNIGDYFRESLGAKKTFDRTEIPVLAQEYRNLLFELGRLRGTHPDPTIAAANEAEAAAAPPEGQPTPAPTPTGTEGTAPTPVAPAAPTSTPTPTGVAATPAPTPAGAKTDAYSDVGITQAHVRAARNDFVRENGQEPTGVRANKKKGTEGKSPDEIMAEREAEFDEALAGIVDLARQHGYELPTNPRDLNQLVREWQIDPEGFASKRGIKVGPADPTGPPQTAAARPGPRLDRIEPPIQGDLEGGDFVIHSDEQAALEARGWSPEEIAMMPLHQVEAEVAAHKNGEPAPEAAETPAGSPATPLGAVEQPGSPQSLPAGQLAEVAVPENGQPQGGKAALADFDPNAPEESPNPSTSGAPGAPQQRPDGVPAAGAKEVPAVSAEDIAAALAKADTDAAAEAVKKRPGKARSPARIAADAKQARIDALTALLDPNDPGLHPVTDPATGETHFEGPIDPENPVHAAILKEFGYTQEHLDRIAALQNGSGQGVVLRDYNSAEQEGHETGEGLDLTGEKRGEEYQASPTGPAGQRQGRVTKQDKGFTPWKTLLTSKGVVIRGFDHDKFFSNLREVLDAADEAGIETGLDGKKGKERDQAIADAFRKVSENHANGWKGDGSEPLKTFPDTGVDQNFDYIGQPVDAALADVINMAMNIRTARPPKPPRINKGQTAPTDKAQADFAAASAAAKEAQGLAQLNDGFLNPETGEVNALRNELESQGFETGKRLKPTVSNVRADLIEGGIHDTPTHGRTVHAHGFDIAPKEFTVSGSPRAKQTGAGFMPGEGGAEHGKLANFDEPSIESKVTDNPRFKAWFGDSKVTEGDGRPKVLYHGGSFDATDKFSDAIFTSEHEGIHFGSKEAAQERIGGKVVDDIIKDSDVFEDEGEWHYEIQGMPGDYDQGFQSEADAKAAMEREAVQMGEYAEVDDSAANITPVYLRLENPVRLPDLQTWPIEKVIPQLVKKGALKPDQVAGIGQDFAKLKEAVKANGFDGIVYRNEFEHKGEDSYIAFDSNQIKSAELNNGEFDGGNADIRFMPGEGNVDADHVYHVTRADLLKGIAASGLQPGKKRFIGEESYDGNRKGNVFASEREGVSFWEGKAQDHIFDQFDDFDKKGIAPIVLRLKKPETATADEEGSQDSRSQAYKIPGEVKPEDLEVWDGSAWVSVKDAKIDPSTSFDENGYFQREPPLSNPRFMPSKEVEEAAKKEGYTIKAFHSTNGPEFNEFRTKGLAAHFGDEGAAQDRAGQLADFSTNVVGRQHAEARNIPVFLKIKNPLEMPDLAALHDDPKNGPRPIEEAQKEWLDKLSEEDRQAWENPDDYEGDVQDDIQREHGDFPRVMAWESETDFATYLVHEGIIDSEEFWKVQYDPQAAVELLKEKGYDGIEYTNAVENPGSKSFIPFDASQIKSSDPATKDDAGNEIPLGKRFNAESNDMRFMPGQSERGQLEFFDPNEVDSAKPSRWKLDSYKKAGDTVDGREVINADNIPNQSSIEAELGASYEILPGIREVPIADFPGLDGTHYSVQGQKRIDSLADAIQASEQITPLIVVEDANGPYVLEGATRAEALYKLGAKSFPAMVVKDTTHGDEHFMPGQDQTQITEALDGLSKKHGDKLRSSAHVTEVKGKPVIKLDDLAAAKDAPAGTGTAFMEDLVALADKEGVPIVLQTASKGDLKEEGFKSTSSGDRLKKFYRRFGFKDNYSKRNYRPDLPGNMNRQPEGNFMPGSEEVEAGGYRWNQSQVRDLQGDKLVMVKVPEFDAAWKKDEAWRDAEKNGYQFYIPTEGGGGEIGGRMKRFDEWRSADKPIEAPFVSVDKNGAVSFINGRHRYSTFRNEGAETLPVSMDPDSIERARENGLLAEEPESSMQSKVGFMPGDNPMWTKENAGEVLGRIKEGRLVGSVEKKGKSDNDLDVHVESYDQEAVEGSLKDLNFEYQGSQIVSPEEASKLNKRQRKNFPDGWHRVHIYKNPNGKRVDVWTSADKEAEEYSGNSELGKFMPSDFSGRGDFDAKPSTPEEKKTRFRADMMAQMKWMGEQAKEAGHDSVETLMTEDPAKYGELATKWREDHPRFDKAGNQLFMPGTEKPITPAQRDRNFRKWAGKKAQILDFPNGEEIDPNKSLAVRGFHGSTHEFNTVNTDIGNPENHFGKGFYITDSKTDVGENYAGEGPDLTNRIERRAEMLDNEIQGMEAPEIAEQYGITEEQAQSLIDGENYTYGSPQAKAKNDLLQEIARKGLHGGAPMTYPVWVKMEKPLVLEKDGGTRFDALEKYDETTDEYSENPDSMPMKLYDSIHENAAQYGVDAQQLWADINDAIGSEWDGATAYDVEQAMRESNALMDAQDGEGNANGPDLIKEVFRGMGFDGIVMDADSAFGNARKRGKAMAMDYGTRHYIVFEPTQVKSATGNKGTFDPQNPDMRAMPGEGATPKRTWFIRDGKRVYHARNRATGKFAEKQTLAKAPVSALDSPHKKKKGQLADFK